MFSSLITFIVFDIMATEKPTFNFKDCRAMFEKLNSGSAPPVAQKKQTVVTAVKSVQPPVAQKSNTNNKGGWEVETSPIVKPNLIKQSLQSNAVNNPNSSPNKLASSFSNNPWIQQNQTGKITQKTAPPAPVRQTKPQNALNIPLKQTTSQTFSDQSKQPQPQKVVKITQNALVDKESLPSQMAMKQLIEGRLSGIIGVKKPQQAPKRMTYYDKVDEGPRQTPVVQTELKLGSVKENANRLNDFYQNRQTQKRQAEEQQAKRKQQQSEQLALRQKEKEQPSQKVSQDLRVQPTEHLSQQSNTQNINVGFFSQVPDEPVQAHSNVLNVVSSSNATEQAVVESVEQSKDTKAEQNNLINRLNKRKKMTKARFDSDDD